MGCAGRGTSWFIISMPCCGCGARASLRVLRSCRSAALVYRLRCNSLQAPYVRMTRRTANGGWISGRVATPTPQDLSCARFSSALAQTAYLRGVYAIPRVARFNARAARLAHRVAGFAPFCRHAVDALPCALPAHYHCVGFFNGASCIVLSFAVCVVRWFDAVRVSLLPGLPFATLYARATRIRCRRRFAQHFTQKLVAGWTRTLRLLYILPVCFNDMVSHACPV